MRLGVLSEGIEGGRLVLTLVPARVPLLCHVRQRNVADSDAKHYPFAFRIGQLFRQFAGFFRPRAPSPRVVHAMWHRYLPHAYTTRLIGTADCW